ncbi:PREDICTED: cyclic AMP-dependent transcription factor ATF-4 [Thamnophis sirtalis]|uniref:Cyclic AMP-dependent transcription factor ATF-4 n=1 Tax=Thamnophis sirtalis TaxID=35019 RepID=A0A6I9YJ13_9SAUR|nr:PREDICTED: cyclic AMP-dependent transcription factor ATF-4 [Thamnophis sirtalis]
MSCSNTEMLLGDSLSPFSQQCLVADIGLGLLDDYLEVAKNVSSHGFSSAKAKVGFSDSLDVDSWNNATDSNQEDAFSGMDWMVEKMDLKEFDFDALLGIDLEATVSPDLLMATLEDTCDVLDPPIEEIPNKESLLMPEPINQSPRSPEADQVAPLTTLLPFPVPQGPLISTVDHSFSLELGSEVDILEGDKKTETPTTLVFPKREKEDEVHSDNDSGICMSPESYLESPQRSPATSTSSLSDNQSVTIQLDVSVRPKPYDRPPGILILKIKEEKRVDKKQKKMEQNKTAATRYRQKKRAEQEALSGECRELEQKNEALTAKVDSLSKEIKYLKDLIQEVRKAKDKKVKAPE